MLILITILMPIVMGITSSIKEKFSIKGKAIIVVSCIVSLGASSVYGLVNGMVVWEFLLVGAGTAIAANCGFDFLKEITGFIGSKK